PLSSSTAVADTFGRMLPLASVVPFVLLLASIALFPLFRPHWWDSNKNRAIVSGALAVPLAAYLWFVHGDAGRHALHEVSYDYVSFLSLLTALFVISGGVLVKG